MNFRDDLIGSVLVRVFPRADATPADLRTLARGIRRWIETSPWRVGCDHERLDPLAAGNLPLPSAQYLADCCCKKRLPEGENLTEADRFANFQADLPFEKWVQADPDGHLRFVGFRVYEVGIRGRELHDSLTQNLH